MTTHESDGAIVSVKIGFEVRCLKCGGQFDIYFEDAHEKCPHCKVLLKNNYDVLDEIYKGRKP